MTGRKPRHGGGFDPNHPHRQATRGIDEYQEFTPEEKGPATRGDGPQTAYSQSFIPMGVMSDKPYQQPDGTGQHSEAKTDGEEVDEASRGKSTPRPAAKPPSIIKHGEKTRRLVGRAHAFTGTSWRWKNPHRIKLPGYIYHDPNQKADVQDSPAWTLVHSKLGCRPKMSPPKLYRHRDLMGRIKEVPDDDRYLHHESGELRKLIVSCTDDIFSSESTVTWRRTYMRNCSPKTIRVATWVIDVQGHPDGWWTWCKMAVKTIPAGLLMSTFYMEGMEATEQFQGNFAPIPYKYNGIAKVWSNQRENYKDTSAPALNMQSYRQLRPRLLCFWRHPVADEDDWPGVDVCSPEAWEEANGPGEVASYVFVTYTSMHFASDDDNQDALHLIGEQAARDAGVPAYWVAPSCMSKNEEEMEKDVYRIADVLRGAHSMVIAVQRSQSPDPGQRPLSEHNLLAEWGSRIWTFPEVLLSPGLNIRVYERGIAGYKVISKSQFAAIGWASIDAEDSSQLVNHYLGSLELSRLELSIIALRCLFRRKTTEKWMDGDHTYALMGLLRCRPLVDKKDSQFQAFARLSIANDSDRLLERYLCTLPWKYNQQWHDMSDAYQASLWDIEPRCQVAGICEDDAVILDGAWGASIRWKSFFPVKCTAGDSFRRWLAVQIMLNQGWLLTIASTLFGLLPTQVSNPATPAPTAGADVSAVLNNGTDISNIDWSSLLPYDSVIYWVVYGLGFLFVAAYLLVVVYSSRLIRIVYGGKMVDTQAALFGFEGYLDAATVEKSIFGGVFGRMGWSENGSPLSRWHINEYGERLGVDPKLNDTNVETKIRRARHAGVGQPRIFTLVDTNSMEMTLFEAVRPPVCVILCGSEGGMQRAVGCSYEWTTQTMYRETVLRMPTESLDKMARVPRFRMGIPILRRAKEVYPRTGSGRATV